jgi:hypothetical protein
MHFDCLSNHVQTISNFSVFTGVTWIFNNFYGALTDCKPLKLQFAWWISVYGHIKDVGTSAFLDSNH